MSVAIQSRFSCIHIAPQSMQLLYRKKSSVSIAIELNSIWMDAAIAFKTWVAKIFCLVFSCGSLTVCLWISSSTWRTGLGLGFFNCSTLKLQMQTEALPERSPLLFSLHTTRLHRRPTRLQARPIKCLGCLWRGSTSVRECECFCRCCCLFYWLGWGSGATGRKTLIRRLFWSFVGDIIEKLSVARMCLAFS